MWSGCAWLRMGFIPWNKESFDVQSVCFLSFISTGVCQVPLFRGTGFPPECAPANAALRRSQAIGYVRTQRCAMGHGGLLLKL